LLLRLQKKIEMKIFVSRSQESLEKNNGYPLQCSAIMAQNLWIANLHYQQKNGIFLDKWDSHFFSPEKSSDLV
jgi:hypothetical protein